MKNNTFRWVIGTAVGIVVLYLLSFNVVWDGRVYLPVTIVVVSDSGLPIPNAQITANPYGDLPDFLPNKHMTGTTGPDGVAQVLCPFPAGGDRWGTGLYTEAAIVQCSAEGYVDGAVPITKEKRVRYHFVKPSFSVKVVLQSLPR